MRIYNLRLIEVFDMFLEFLRDVNKNTVQRLYRTRLHGMDSAPTINDNKRSLNRMKIQHDEASGMGFLGSPKYIDSTKLSTFWV